MPPDLQFSTPRLRLAPVAEADRDALYALVNLPAVASRLRPSLPREGSPDQALDDRLRLLARQLRDGRPVGMLAFDGPWLSYAVAPSDWGCGLGAELVQAAVRHCGPQLGLPQLRARVERDNVRSRRLLESAGFRFEGVAPRPSRHALELLLYRRHSGL